MIRYKWHRQASTNKNKIQGLTVAKRVKHLKPLTLVKEMKTKKRSLQISRHSSSNSFWFPKKSILKLTQKVPLKLAVFFEAVKKFVWKLVRSMLFGALISHWTLGYVLHFHKTNMAEVTWMIESSCFEKINFTVHL